jgi:dsDNA-binding SOS-regulon protein
MTWILEYDSKKKGKQKYKFATKKEANRAYNKLMKSGLYHPLDLMTWKKKYKGGKKKYAYIGKNQAEG